MNPRFERSSSRANWRTVQTLVNRCSRAGLLVWFAVALTGCMDSGKRAVEKLVQKTKVAATQSEWRTWANQIIERSKTNSGSVPRMEWPQFVRDFTNDGRKWDVRAWSQQEQGTNTTLVGVVALGGFESIGVIIGPETYVEVAPQNYPQISEMVYPGIYVRETH